MTRAGYTGVNSSVTAADAYAAAEAEKNERHMEMCRDAIHAWLAAEYEQDGYTGDQIGNMDLESVADTLIERAREKRRR